MTKELERSENDVEKSRLARKQMEEDYHGSQRRVRDLEEERAQAVHDTEMAKLETNFQQDLSPAKTAAGLDGDEYGDDSGRNKELSRNLADARAKAQYLEVCRRTRNSENIINRQHPITSFHPLPHKHNKHNKYSTPWSGRRS